MTTTHDLTTQRTLLADLRPHPRNPRNGDTDAIVESLRVNGQYAPIVTARDGTVLVGNHRYMAALELGWTEMDTVTLDLDPESPEALRIMLVDNRTSDLAMYDDAQLRGLLDELAALDDLEGTGYLPEDLDQLAKDLDGLGLSERYTPIVNVPQYEPVGPCPPVGDLADTTKADDLISQVRAADLPDDLKQYLMAAASRHIVFNYRLAAEFYPHQTPEVQALMEDSALVIIDLDDAIRNGFARLDAALDDQLENDHDESQPVDL